MNGRAETSAAPVEEVVIDSIGGGGEGVGRLEDGRVAFVGRTAPGEKVRFQPTRSQKRWMRGQLVEILEPSEDRRDAPCPHHSVCGGCTLEHLVYPAQLTAKARMVKDALERIGGVEVALPEVVASPREFHYRNRVSFTLRRLKGGRIVAGFFSADNSARIEDIDGSCMLPEEPVAQVWEALRREWGPGAERLPAGDQLRLTLRGSGSGEVSLVIDGGRGGGRPEELLERVDGLVSIWSQRDGQARLLAGVPTLRESWGDSTLELRGSTFLQVNREAAGQLEDYVIALAGDTAGTKIVDAYCGVGEYARRLAQGGASVTGIELDAGAIEVANEVGDGKVDFISASVEERMESVLPADLVLLNPPRSGIDSRVAESLNRQPPGRIIYISCDPATLARDVRALSSHFRAGTIRCFDMFPQTAHVETVLELIAT